MSLKYFFSICFALLSIAVSARQVSECNELFSRVIQKASTQRSNKNTNFEFKGTVAIKQTDGRHVSDNMHVRMNSAKYSYSSAMVTIYQDEADMVTIHHAAKTILIGRAQPQELRERQFSQVLSITDSIQRHLILKECIKEYGTIKATEGYRKISFIPSEVLSNSGIKQVDYWVYEPDMSVRKIKMTYGTDNSLGILEYDFVIDVLSYAYPGNPFEGRATRKVLGDKGLLMDYKNYQLIDKRK